MKEITFPTITKATYVRMPERGDIVLQVEFEGLKPMTFYSDAVKGIILEEGVVPRLFGNSDYEYEYDYGEPIPGSKLGLSGPATQHPGLVRLLRRFYEDRLLGRNVPGTDITEELQKIENQPWKAPGRG